MPFFPRITIIAHSSLHYSHLQFYLYSIAYPYNPYMPCPGQSTSSRSLLWYRHTVEHRHVSEKSPIGLPIMCTCIPYIPVYNAMFFLSYSCHKKAPRIIHRCRIYYNFFSSLAVSSLAVKLICKRRPVSVFGRQTYTTRTTVRL